MRVTSLPDGLEPALTDLYLDSVEQILHAKPNPNAAAIAGALTAQMYSPGYVANQLATGADTVFPAFARENLPLLKERLVRSAKKQGDEAARLHLLKMAERITRILKD